MNKVVELKTDATASNGMKFKRTQEFQVVNDVVYMGGNPVEYRHQAGLLAWIKKNPDLFRDVTYKYM